MLSDRYRSPACAKSFLRLIFRRVTLPLYPIPGRRTGRRFVRRAASESVWFVVDRSTERSGLHRTVALVVINRHVRLIDGELQIIGPKAMPLGIRVREDTALQQLVADGSIPGTMAPGENAACSVSAK